MKAYFPPSAWQEDAFKPPAWRFQNPDRAEENARYPLFTDLAVGEFLHRQAAASPDRPFVVYPDRDLSFTYKEFEARVDAVSRGLLEIGVKPGDKVGIWSRNVPDWLTYFFAAAGIGAIPVTVNTYYKSHELSFVMAQSDMACLCLVDGYRGANYSYLDILYELVPELRRHERGKLRSHRFPRLRAVVYIGPEKHRGLYNTNELLVLGNRVSDDRRKAAAKACRGADVVNIQYTSGTTGFPKGVMLSSEGILNNGFYIGERQKFTNDESKPAHLDRGEWWQGCDRVCVPVPLFHCFGIVLGIMAILSHGATAVMVEQFEPEAVLDAVERARATAVYGVPTMFIAEMSHPRFAEYRDRGAFKSLRTGLMSGAPCPMQWLRKCMTEMQMNEVCNPYGLTESSPVFLMTAADDEPERKVTTIGRPLPNSEVKVINPETGEVVEHEEVGELCVRGYQVMKGYYNMPEQTDRVVDKDGWLHSGDLGKIDEHGFFYITGRLKDMIIRGGENISPREIEEFLYKMPGVRDVQIVGAEDARFGEVPVAFVVKADGAEITAQEIRDHARARIAPYKVPEHVFFVDGFPLTASGKIQKYVLRQMANERIAEMKKA